MRESSPSKNSFFSTSPTPAFIALVKGPTVYEALAVALCDVVRTQALLGVSRAKKLNSILGKIKTSMQTSPAEVLIPQIAKELYSLTLDGLKQHPTRYHQYALPPEERDYPSYWIARSAPDVISDLLGIDIHLKHVKSGKPLHATTINASKAACFSLKLQVRHGQYSALVKDSTYFSHPRPAHEFDNPDALPALSALLQTENEAILIKFRETFNHLSTMVEAGELTKEGLLELYIESIPTHRVNGTQAFFDSIHIDNEGHQAHLIFELIHVLARLIAFGDIPKEALFQQIEEPTEAFSHSC